MVIPMMVASVQSGWLKPLLSFMAVAHTTSNRPATSKEIHAIKNPPSPYKIKRKGTRFFYGLMKQVTFLTLLPGGR